MNLFDPAIHQSLVDRLARLTPESERQWGKMTQSQMLGHCTAALLVGTGDTPRDYSLVGRLLGWTVRKKLLSPDGRFSRNSPTDPTFIVRDERDFTIEMARLRAAIERFVERGPQAAGQCMHSFLGRMTGDEWGILMAKHLDHHLRQFGV
jgi:hypothetical protein